jgi:UDP-MurNAc hydroxylase
MREKVARVRRDLMSTLVRKCQVTGAAAYLPSAGPACFLDPALTRYNDRDATIFPAWEDVEQTFRAALPELPVVRCLPGDRLHVEGGQVRVEPYAGERPSSDLAEYSERRRGEWEAFHATQERPITSEEIAAYFLTLERRNPHVMQDFSKTIQVAADAKVWTVKLGELAQDYVIEGEEPYDPEYSLILPGRVLRAVLDGRAGWEEALLSMRVQLRRTPDVFDSRFMGLLRYGNEPVQTKQMMREHSSRETIERDGLRVQRFCPHAGEDLTFATLCGGVLECPRHHWKWDVQTGECVEGGNLPLRVEPLPAQAAEKAAE